jgi:hypothetical protein
VTCVPGPPCGSESCRDVFGPLWMPTLSCAAPLTGDDDDVLSVDSVVLTEGLLVVVEVGVVAVEVGVVVGEVGAVLDGVGSATAANPPRDRATVAAMLAEAATAVARGPRFATRSLWVDAISAVSHLGDRGSCVVDYLICRASVAARSA